MSGLVDGEVAIVAGGGSGIGRAIANAYVREGGTVVVADRSGGQDQVAAELGDAALPVTADMVDPTSVEAMVEAAVSRFGKLDSLFNCVGVCDVFDPIVDMDPGDFERILRTNVLSAFLGIKYAVPAMLTGGGGSIVNLASVGGMAATPGISAYCSSKAGVILLTKTAALEYGRQGIRVNAICPGPTRTPMTDSMTENPRVLASLRASSALDRIGEPEEIAEVALMLASRHASFVTGAAVPVDGGRLASADSRQIALESHG